MLLVSVVVPFNVRERTGVADDERVVTPVALLVPEAVPVLDDVIERLVDGDAVGERVEAIESVPERLITADRVASVDSESLGDALELFDP